MATRIIDDSKLNDIAVAIQAKDSGGQMTVDDMPTRIANIPSGGGVKEKTVNFYNYDGELLYSYTANEVAELTELPEAPMVQGLTFLRWTWSLTTIKSWVLNHSDDILPIGAIFITDDNHTRIYMTLYDSTQANEAMPFYIKMLRGSLIIDWGDNSSPETITSSGIYSHLWQVDAYPANVKIDITNISTSSNVTILGNDGGLGNNIFNNHSYYSTCVNKIEFGGKIEGILSGFFNIKAITCPTNSSYSSPNSISTVFATSVVSGSSNIKNVSLIEDTTRIPYNGFSYCRNIKRVALSDSITVIDNSGFRYCSNLLLKSLPKNLKRIGNDAFEECDFIYSLSFPGTLTTVGAYAFNGCSNLRIIDLTAFTNPQNIPTLSNINAFNNTPKIIKFLVANQEMYDAFTTATNWSTYASKFVIEGA